MHSPENEMNEVETKNILEWARKLLDRLQISDETYYKEAIQYLKDVSLYLNELSVKTMLELQFPVTYSNHSDLSVMHVDFNLRKLKPLYHEL